MFGQRLKEERKRVGLTQPKLGEIVSLTKRTVIDWEKDKSSPTAIQLAAMAKHGFDVSYLITGIRTQPIELPSDEAFLLDSFRSLNAEQKKMTLQFLLGGIENIKERVKPSVDNKNNQGVIGDTDGDVSIDNSTDKSADSSNQQGVFHSPNSPISNSFNTQSGFTELPFIWACAFCGSMAWLLGALASWKAATDMAVSLSFGQVGLVLWCVTIIMAVFGYHAGKTKYDEVQANNRLKVSHG